MSEARTSSQLSTRDSQISLERRRSKPSWDRYLLTMFPPRSAAMARSRRCRRRSSTSIFDHSEITQNAPVSSKASVCSCHVDFQGDILHGLIFFYKNKILNFLFNEIVSVAFTFSLFNVYHSISHVEENLPAPKVAPKWPRNLKNLAVLEHFGTNYLDIVVLLTRAQIWKTSSIKRKVTHNWAALHQLHWTGVKSDNFDFSFNCECRGVESILLYEKLA